MRRTSALPRTAPHDFQTETGQGAATKLLEGEAAPGAAPGLCQVMESVGIKEGKSLLEEGSEQWKGKGSQKLSRL